MSSPTSSPAEITIAIAPLAADPRRAAACFDLDGTLAPIIGRPEDAVVPSRPRELVGRIAERYAVAAIISGRQSLQARRILGLGALTYVGNHGFEVLHPGAEEPEPAPALEGMAGRAAEFVSGLAPDRLEGAELRLEDKAAIRALHWRGAADEERAEAIAYEIGAEAEAAGLFLHRGRKVLELRPPVELDKGDGIRALLEAARVDAAFYAGDDRTDIDGFRALGELVEEGVLDSAIRVAVVGDETPDEVSAAADLAVDGPEGFIAVLEALA